MQGANEIHASHFRPVMKNAYWLHGKGSGQVNNFSETKTEPWNFVRVVGFPKRAADYPDLWPKVAIIVNSAIWMAILQIFAVFCRKCAYSQKIGAN